MSVLFDESGIQVGVDQSDHMAFFCPKCGSVMVVRNVRTRRKMLVNTRTGETDNCTYVYLQCNSCKTIGGKRKFYWNDDGTYCDDRTSSPLWSVAVTNAVKRALSVDFRGAPANPEARVSAHMWIQALASYWHDRCLLWSLWVVTCRSLTIDRSR